MYPEEEKKTSHLVPIKLSYSLLIEIVSKVHEKLKTSKWIVKNAMEYMSVHCINSKAREEVIDHAILARSLESMLQCDKNKERR